MSTFFLLFHLSLVRYTEATIPFSKPSIKFISASRAFIFVVSSVFSSWLALPFHEGLSSNVASPEKFLDIKEPFRCQSLPIPCFLHNTYLKLLIYLYACLLYAPLGSKR